MWFLVGLFCKTERKYSLILPEIFACKVNKNILQVGCFSFFRPLKSGSYQFIYQLIRALYRYDFSFIHNGNAVAQNFRFIHVMGGYNNGGSFFSYSFYQIPKVSPGLRIQASRGFIQENNFRLID